MKKFMRSTLIMALAVAMLFSLAGCSTNKTTEPKTNTTPAVTGDKASFPKGPITWVVPWKPGGANDICARLIGPELRKCWAFL
jgi:tripartite-type tricarboxylate transporter receptor subunit TctC